MRILRPLRSRDFALLWAGMTVSLLGDGIWLVAGAWQVYALSNDPTALSLVGTSWTLGMVAFLLFGGVVSDRVERRRVLVAADLLRAAALVVLGVLAVSGAIAVWHIVALALLLGVGDAFFGPAFGALVPDVVAADRLVEANALDQFVRHAAGRLAGPALGGLVVAVVGPGTAFLVDAATFAASAACIAALRTRSLPAPRAAARSARAELREGLRFVRGEPWLWATLIAASTSMLFFFGPLEVLLPYVVKNRLGAGAGAYGAVLATAGIGAIVASLIVSQRGLPRRYLTFMYAAWGAATLPLIGYALGSAVWQLAVFAAVYGACTTAGMVVWGTLMQTRVPPALRGRVHSLDWFVSVGLTPVSFALTGPAASLLGVEATLIVAGAVPCALTALLFFAARLRRDEERVPAIAVAGRAEAAPEPGRAAVTA